MDEYHKYFRRLKQIVSTEVVPKTAIFDYFTRHIYRRDQDPAKVEPLIWYIQSGLLSDLTFSIYRLFDHKAQRNLLHFTTFAQDNAASIDWQNPLTPEDFRDHRKLLQSVYPIRESLRLRRHKYFAHYDAEFFYEPDTIDSKYPFSNEDAMALVRVAQEIVSAHSHAVDGSHVLSVDGFFYIAAEQLYEKLRASYPGGEKA